jgi:hypothetical protein
MSIEKGRLADPEVMIDEVERGLARRQEILIPGAEAKITMWMRRFFPRLLWKVIHRSNQ